MRSDSKETIIHRECPPEVIDALRDAGGENRFSEPMFRIVWGWNRIVQMTGKWEEWEQGIATLTDKITKYSEQRKFTRLKSSVVESREVPKYLPGNCWHLEMWRPPEEYGTSEQWGKLGEEVVGTMTLDTSGPYPYLGEYELCYPLTADGTSHGQPIPLVASVVADICQMIRSGKERFTFLQRRAAIEQEVRKKEEGFVRVTMDILKDGLRPFAGEPFIVMSRSKGNA